MRTIETKIVVETFKLIEERQGGSGINLREIARRVGCAHTSIYNYYPTLDALLNDVAAISVERMRESLSANSNEKNLSAKEQLLDFTSRLFDYAIKHSGEYSLLWFEGRLQGGSDTLRSLVRPEKLFIDSVADLMGLDIDDEKVIDRSALIQSYFHGEVSKYICGATDQAQNEIKERIMRNTNSILENLQ